MVTELLRGRYEVLEAVGHGGEGQVVKALDRQLDRIVALKIRAVGSDVERDELLSEARVLLALPPHPHLPLVREDFFEGDRYVIAMDWVEGTDLGRLLQAQGRPGLAPSLVVNWLADAAAALTHLHKQHPPVVHGDLKPANLILTHGGRLTLVDFGLSSSPRGPRRRSGTPGFAAPELAGGEGAQSRATDVYGLAATAHALLTGTAPDGVQPPWSGIEPEQQADALEQAIRAGLATDPARRPETAGQFVEQLRAGWGASLPTGVLTFCFTDIVGSTALWEAQPAEMARSLVVHDELVASTVERRGGRFLKSMGEGDATVSVFTSPHDAVGAAFDISRRLAAQAWPDGLAIEARVAVHTGEAEQRGGDYFGTTLNTAARIRGLADGGEVFLSAATASLVADHLPEGASLVDLGPHRLRGLRQPELVYALAAPGLVVPPPASECPYPGLVALSVGRRRPVLRAGGGRCRPGRARRAGTAAGSRRWVGQRQVVGAAGRSSARRWAVAPSSRRAAIRWQRSTPMAEPVCSSSTSSRSSSPRARTSTSAGGSPIGCWRRSGPSRSACAPTSTATAPRTSAWRRPWQPTRCCSGRCGTTSCGERSSSPLARPAFASSPASSTCSSAKSADEPGALPLLAHALRATWERRDGRTLTLDAYHETGGVHRAIADTADRVLAEFDSEDRELARRLLLRMVQPGDGTADTRRRAPLDELRSAGGDTARVTDVLDALAAARLVTVDGTSAEVAHEALIREWPALRSWLDDDREGLRLHRQVTEAAAAWDELGREPAELYRGPRLAAAIDWRDSEPQLSDLEAEFLDASETERDRAARAQIRTNRRLRGLLVAAGIGLVAAVAGASFAIVQGRRAADERDRAEVARLAALSRATVERQPDIGLLLAAEAYQREDNAASRSSLLEAVATHPLLSGLLYGVDSGLEAAVFSPDGRLLATPTSDGSGTLLWDTATRRRLAALRNGDDIVLGAAISPDGRRLVVPAISEAARASHLQVWDLETRTLERTVPSPAGALTSVWFSADGKQVVAQGGPVIRGPPPPTAAVVWDAATWEPIGKPWTLVEQYQGDRVITVSADGRRVASPAGGSQVAAWDVGTRRPLGPPLDAGVGPPTALAFTGDGSVLAVAGDLGEVALVDPATGAHRLDIQTPEGIPTALEFIDAGRDRQLAKQKAAFKTAFAFDRAMLLALPQGTVTAQPTTFDKPASFSGPVLRELLGFIEAAKVKVTFVALDGYTGWLAPEDIDGPDWILALSADGVPLGLGQEGPIWLVKSGKAEVDRDDPSHGSWVWGLFYIHIGE